jgi:hypothetical protein
MQTPINNADQVLKKYLDKELKKWFNELPGGKLKSESSQSELPRS